MSRGVPATLAITAATVDERRGIRPAWPGLLRLASEMTEELRDMVRDAASRR
jgi:hypothetical protein